MYLLISQSMQLQTIADLSKDLEKERRKCEDQAEVIESQQRNCQEQEEILLEERQQWKMEKKEMEYLFLRKGKDFDHVSKARKLNI